MKKTTLQYYYYLCFQPLKLKGVEEGGNVVKWTEKEGDEEAKWYSWSVFRCFFDDDFCEWLSHEKAHSKSSLDVYVKPAGEDP